MPFVFIITKARKGYIHMDIDRRTIDELKKLDDEKLKAVFSKIVASLGANQGGVQKPLPDVSVIRAVLSKLSENDIKRAIGVIGQEKADNILRNIKQGGDPV